MGRKKRGGEETKKKPKRNENKANTKRTKARPFILRSARQHRSQLWPAQRPAWPDAEARARPRRSRGLAAPISIRANSESEPRRAWRSRGRRSTRQGAAHLQACAAYASIEANLKIWASPSMVLTRQRSTSWAAAHPRACAASAGIEVSSWTWATPGVALTQTSRPEPGRC